MKVKQCLFQLDDARFVLTVRLNDGLPKTISISGRKPFRFNGVIAKHDRADIIGVLNTTNEIEVAADDKTYLLKFEEDCTQLYLINPAEAAVRPYDIVYTFKDLN